MDTCTVSICTTARSMPAPRTICPHKWNFTGQILSNQTVCDECDVECFNHCGTKVPCPCNMVKVIKPKSGQVLDLTEPGLYIQLRKVKYVKIGNSVKIGE